VNVKGCSVDREPVGTFEGDDFLRGEVVGDGSRRAAGLLNGDAVVFDASAKRVWDFAANDGGFPRRLERVTSIGSMAFYYLRKISSRTACAVWKARGVTRTSQGVFWELIQGESQASLLAGICIDGEPAPAKRVPAWVGFKWEVAKVSD